MEESNKLKISSDFLIEKTVLIVSLFIILLLLSDFHRTENGFPTGYLITIPCLIAVLCFLYTRPTVKYDENFIFIKKWKKDELKIPLEKIQSIKLSILGLKKNGASSWLVSYLTENSEMNKIRIFPSIFSSPFSTFMNVVKSKNPNINIRDWSFGINELFD